MRLCKEHLMKNSQCPFQRNFLVEQLRRHDLQSGSADRTFRDGLFRMRTASGVIASEVEYLSKKVCRGPVSMKIGIFVECDRKGVCLCSDALGFPGTAHHAHQVGCQFE